MQIYLVGGAVRDKLLGIQETDNDYVVIGASIQDMLNMGYQQVGKSFPVFLHPITKCEYALARTERKMGHGYTGFCFDFSPKITLEEDLKRRDLTINAIAQDQDGNLIDPYNGQQDLKNRILRHVSSFFRDDPLRVLRVARFAAKLAPYDFKVAPETINLMKEISNSGELKYLTPERIFKEFDKVLHNGYIDVFIKVLKECDALKVLFPEIDNLYGIPARKYWHPEIDTGIHMELSLHYASIHNYSPLEKIAVFCHDFGKALTDPAKLPSHKDHGIKGVPLVKKFVDRLKMPSEYKEVSVLVAAEHSFIHTALYRTSEELLSLFLRIDAFRKPNHVEILLNSARADIRGRLGFENIQYSHADLVHDIFEHIQTISTKEIIAEGYKGIEIRNELNKRRLLAIDKFKAKWLEDHKEIIKNEKKEDPEILKKKHQNHQI